MEHNEMFGHEPEDHSAGQICIKFYLNGSTKLACKVSGNTNDDDIWKIKKRLLKKLNFDNYKSKKFQENVRLFTKKGLEITEHDIEDLTKQDSLFYSLGEDFDWNVRINALKFQKHLGKGGFGEVNLCIDELTGQKVAVKYLNFANKNQSNQMITKEIEALSTLQHKNVV